MLREDYIPTPLIRRSEREKLSLVKIRQPEWFLALASLRYLTRFVWLLIRLRFQRIPTEEKAKHVSSYIHARGGLWIKMGQLMATRRETLADAYCDELEKLHDRADGFPAEYAREIIESELGRKIDQIFSEFITHPVAAASVSQIHRARLKHENVWVAVKVLRPNVEKVFKRDLDLFRAITGLLERLGVWPHMQWRQMYCEVDGMLTEETDLRLEAGSMLAMRRSLQRHREVYVPSVFQRYSSRRLLVAEWVDGVSMSAYLEVLQNDPAKLEEWRRVNCVEPSIVARNMFMTVQRQMYEDNLFHGDLHPGNIMLLRDNRIALIDFGSVGTLDTGLRRRIMLYNRLINHGEIAKAMAVFLSLSAPLPKIDVEAIIRELVRNYRLASKIASSPAFSNKEKATNRAAVTQSRLLREHGIPVCWDFLRLTRTSMTLEISLRSLDPDLDYNRLWKSYLKQRSHRENLRRQRAFTDDAWQLLTSLRERYGELADEAYARGEVRRLVSMRSPSARAELFRMLHNFFVLGVVLLLFAFVGQHHAASFPAFVQAWLGKAADWLPRMSYSAWIVVAVVVLYVHRSLARIGAGIRQETS
jgi:ubiquinone biosynthesis protein